MPSAPLPMGSDFDSQSVAGSSYQRVMAGFLAGGFPRPSGGVPWAGTPATDNTAAAVTATARSRDALRRTRIFAHLSLSRPTLEG
jgi:hypothetical protein